MTDQSSEQTVWQQLACLKRTGHRINLKPYEAIVSVTDEPGKILVVVRTVSLIERSHGFEINKTGLTLVALIKTGAAWTRTDITAWDAEPDVDFCRTIGASITPTIARERMNWAHLCNRPGSGRFPLDSSDRTFVDPDQSTDAMKKHWGVNY